MPKHSVYVIRFTYALPITVGIYSSWGTGKSFLLGKIKEYIETNINLKIKQKRRDLKRKCICNTRSSEHNINYEYIIIDFNAWSYSFSDVLWAGLLKKYTKVEDRYDFCFAIFQIFHLSLSPKLKQKILLVSYYMESYDLYV